MLPNNSAWQDFYDSMQKRTGLDLSKYKAHQLQRRIISMMDTAKVDNLDQFWKWLESSPENVTSFMDRLAINVSELFRNPEKWAELKDRILPELLSKSPTLKIWSAGCSYGAEAYSMAALLAAHFPGRHRIIGTDIDQAALSQAREGRFCESDMRSAPAEYVNRYFLESNKTWYAKPDLKQYVTFKTGNLLDDRFEPGFDLILCRNVVIYFTEEAKKELYVRFVSSLKNHGILFVGSTERIAEYKDVGLETVLPFFYKKSATEGKVWLSAS